MKIFEPFPILFVGLSLILVLFLDRSLYLLYVTPASSNVELRGSYPIDARSKNEYRCLAFTGVTYEWRGDTY
jgi:hypothetical protein